ncbi:hypothetical protein CHLRE_10g460201v5 [Chlamydomonas reinhardtii]|uniref:Uncharacterized protein n=1 Tax=Chlamydomonas reinhardtii TaxID=3055 RepID=A0A2K3DBT2_CHLRE|nr:uncharacterized protein CHLRE_10g460201v5 [Chlamydomonas reinhardtii]PNW77998.1 hypothetical protein CHLRE_10g460201v5 [Chlamydomonas reinhardtii]
MWAPSRAVRLQQRQGSAAPAAYGEASCSRPCATAGPAAAVPARTSFTLTSETCRQAVCQPARSPGWQGRGRRRGGSAVVPAAWRERTYRGGGGGAEGFGPGSSMNSEETGRMMQMQQQVFELKQRLVESEVQRQAAEKANSTAQSEAERLRHRLMQARWALAAVAALLLVAAGVLLWAELEAPPLGTMALPPGGVPGLLKEWVGGVWARVVGAWALLVAEGRVAALALAAAAARVVPR